MEGPHHPQDERQCVRRPCYDGNTGVAMLRHMDVQYTPRSSRHAPRFPNTIRAYRLKAGLSQKRLGALVGRGRNAISSWERGLTRPDVTLGVRLARVLSTLAESLYQSFYSPPKDSEAADRQQS